MGKIFAGDNLGSRFLIVIYNNIVCTCMITNKFANKNPTVIHVQFYLLARWSRSMMPLEKYFVSVVMSICQTGGWRVQGGDLVNASA